MAKGNAKIICGLSLYTIYLLVIACGGDDRLLLYFPAYISGLLLRGYRGVQNKRKGAGMLFGYMHYAEGRKSNSKIS